jgi:hypothetical protein
MVLIIAHEPSTMSTALVTISVFPPQACMARVVNFSVIPFNHQKKLCGKVVPNVSPDYEWSGRGNSCNSGPGGQPWMSWPLLLMFLGIRTIVHR